MNETPLNSHSRNRRWRTGCLTMLVLFSTFVAIAAYPRRPWIFGSVLGTLAFVSIFLRVGWFVPFTIAGFYFGLMILDPLVKGGDALSRMLETVFYILVGTAGGFVIGALLDKRFRATG